MLTFATRARLIAFAVLAVAVVLYTGIHYANLGRVVGLRGYYVVHLELTNAGGIFTDANVTYRGVSVGRVGAVSLTPTGVQADLDINDSAPRIPANLQAAVADLSAIGEQYVDLRPRVSGGPYLTAGSVIPQHDTVLPLPVTTLLNSLNTLAATLPLGSLQAALDNLAEGLNQQGPTLQGMINGNATLVNAALGSASQINTLVSDGKTVLATQAAEGSALQSFASGAVLLAHQLDLSDPDLRRLIQAAPQAATQVAGLIADNNTSLGILIANLLTTSDVTMTRGPALRELLSALPAAVAAGSTVINSKGARFGIALTFFAPLPCVAGYGGTVYRNGLNLLPPPPLNTSAQCTLPASSGTDVRGSAHAPSGGPVPPAAQAGLARLLGLTG
jgi:phospholipid/cholesterol/gamma-HCH transport system substrate-binding protein